MTEPNAAEWLSAWSTFWGAIAGGVGAIGTAGALWLGAVTFRRQVIDNHRAQSRAVSVTLESGHMKGYVSYSTASIWNDSGFPIYRVAIVMLSASGQEIGQAFKPALPPKQRLDFTKNTPDAHNAYATFVDSGGSRWRRYFNGDLEELDRGRGGEEAAVEEPAQGG